MISNHPDGLNINVDCGSTHIEQLQKHVLENKLDVGFAFDGDADRCLAVDEKGNVCNGDHILYLSAKYLQERGMFGNSKVVTTIMSNMGLYKALDELGIGYEKTAVGDKYVAENMKKNGHLIGGEQSGHIIFARYATTGDGVAQERRGRRQGRNPCGCGGPGGSEKGRGRARHRRPRRAAQVRHRAAAARDGGSRNAGAL